MQTNSELAPKINDSGKQDENKSFMFIDDEQRDLKILRHKRFTAIEMGFGCRSGLIDLLLSDRGYEDRELAQSFVHDG